MNALLGALLSRPRTIVTLLLFLIGAGATVFVTIPKEATPDIDVPLFYVSIVQPGISPEDAERLLVRPMETALRSLEGLKEIRATASEGHASIFLEYNTDFEQEAALADVRAKVDLAKAELPVDAEEPLIVETNLSLVPTIIVALSGDVPERTLYQHARRLKDAVEAIPSVLRADLSGSREEMLEVVIDRTRMESYGLEPVGLLQALQRNNALVAAGFLDTGEGRFPVKVPGLIEDAQDVYSMVVKQSDMGVVTVGDIAEIRRTFKDPTTFTRVNGRPAITIDVVKRIGENIIINNEAVRQVVASASADWPETVRVDYLLDQSSFIFEVLGGLNVSIITAILCVMIVVIASLGFRSAVLVGVSIPTTILISFLVLSGLGMTVNMMVMFGLVLTIGMLVDGSIIMVEYAERRISEGAGRIAAFGEAAKVMAWPLLSSTLTTLIAFLPLLLFPGMAGEFMAYIPIMAIITLTVATVTAMVFLPVLGGVLSPSLLAGLVAAGVAGSIGFLVLAPLGGIAWAGACGAGLVGFVAAAVYAERRARGRPAPLPVPAGPFDVAAVRGATGLYVRVLRVLAGRPLGLLATLVLVVGLAGGSLFAFVIYNTGVEFFVDEEPDVAIVTVSGRGNMSAREALDLVRDVEAEVLAIDGVDNVVMRAFPSGGGSQSGGLGVNDLPADLIGQFEIELVPYCCRRQASEIFADIRDRGSFPGLKTEVREVEGGPPTGKDVQLQVTATSYDALVASVARARAKVDTVAGLRDVEDDRPLPGIEWQLDVDREEAGRFGADVQTLGALIQLVTNGALLTRYQPDDSIDQLDVRARFPEDERTLDQFGDLRLTTAMGQVPVINFIDVTPQQRVSSITRVDGLYAMTIKADVVEAEGVDLNGKIAELDTWVTSQEWPQGVFFTFRGANEDQAEAMAFLGKAAAAAFVMMFLVLVTQFNSFYQAVITLVTIVLSVFGVLLGMAITGQKFSVIMSGVGVIALAGIVVNNAIILIDTFKREEREQPDVLTAVLATAAQRIRPILLTTITTIAGLVPMATQVNIDLLNRTTSVGGITSIWWVQLSTAIISGLAFSTVLTLVVVPVLLAMPETVMRAVRREPRAGTGVPALGGARPVPFAATAPAISPFVVARPVARPALAQVPPRRAIDAVEAGDAVPEVWAPVLARTRRVDDDDDAVAALPQAAE